MEKTEKTEKTDILDPVIQRYKRMLWIPEEAVSKTITAMNNMITDGTKFEDLPSVFLYPITIDHDSSSQTGDTRFKNLIAFNDYGLLLASQVEETFTFVKDFPKWKNAFARIGNLTTIPKDYPIFVPNDNILAIAFAEMATKEIFAKRCGKDAPDSIFLLPVDEYIKLTEKKEPTQVSIEDEIVAEVAKIEEVAVEQLTTLVKKQSVTLADIARNMEEAI